MVPDLQLELSVSRCQVPDSTTSQVLCVRNVCVSVGFFMCASMPHKELRCPRHKSQGFSTSSRRSPTVSRFKHIPTPPELRASCCDLFVRSIHLTVVIHGSYSPLLWHQLARRLLPFQLLVRFTPTASASRCPLSQALLGVVLVCPFCVGYLLETELLLQCKLSVIHYFELCPQGQNMHLQSLSS